MRNEPIKGRNNKIPSREEIRKTTIITLFSL